MPPGRLLVRNRSPSPGRRSRLPPTLGLADLPGGALAIERFERKRLEERIERLEVAVTTIAVVVAVGFFFAQHFFTPHRFFFSLRLLKIIFYKTSERLVCEIANECSYYYEPVKIWYGLKSSNLQTPEPEKILLLARPACTQARPSLQLASMRSSAWLTSSSPIHPSPHSLATRTLK